MADRRVVPGGRGRARRRRAPGARAGGSDGGDRQRLAEKEAVERVLQGEARRLAESIVEERLALGGRAFGPGFRETVKRGLRDVPIETLRQVEGRSPGNLRAAIEAARTGLRGEGGDDLLLLPTRRGAGRRIGRRAVGQSVRSVPPCRIIDTRFAAAGALAGGGPLFVVTGSRPLFAAQGGNPSGCGVPAGTAFAAFVNFTAVNPAGPGNLPDWAYAPSLPLRPSQRPSTTPSSRASTSRTASRPRCAIP